MDSMKLPALRSVAKVPVEWLALDRENPRLVYSIGELSDADIIAQLYRSEDLSELLQSIAANGYLDIEPLVVLNGDGSLIVLEGNRRLAAIRLFEKPKLADLVSQRAKVRVNVPDFDEEFRSTIHKISVYRVESRADARSFIGFKHINGAAKWQSYAKARFAAKWYEESRNQGVTLEDIAAQIGDKHDTIKRMVNAIYVLDQADETGVFQLSERATPRFNFSHLYTALSRAPYMRFLGLDQAWSRFDPTPSPVAQEKLDSLREVLTWLYGSLDRGIEPVIRSPEPRHKTARRGPREFRGAHGTEGFRVPFGCPLSTHPANQRFSESLYRARREVREASNNLRGFDGQESALVGVAEDILETSQAMAYSDGRESEGRRESRSMSLPFTCRPISFTTPLLPIWISRPTSWNSRRSFLRTVSVSAKTLSVRWSSQLTKHTSMLMMRLETARTSLRGPLPACHLGDGFLRHPIHSTLTTKEMSSASRVKSRTLGTPLTWCR